MKWNEDKYPNWDENHKYDYRWIEDEKEREDWIKEHYKEVEE